MCGRTACCRCSNDYQKATTFFNDKTNEYEQPDWIPHSNMTLQFKPSVNLAPTEAIPVLMSGKHCDNAPEQILQTMIWSLIPVWHKGEYNKHRLSTNNARVEGLRESKLYSSALKRGQRCVIISDGFYEWKSSGASKQPYFIYAKQNEGLHVEEETCWDKAEWNKHTGWNGPKVLHMAGLFDVWQSPDNEIIPSCTIITMKSNDEFSWIHERMPAILDSDEAVREWIDNEGTSADDALNLIKPSSSLQWHPVTTKVGNSKYKNADSCKPIDQSKRPSQESKGLMSWLKTGSLKSPACKKPRTE